MTDIHEIGLPHLLYLLRSLQDGQIDHRAVSAETLATVRPLTALLDLLNRPEDQHTELGQQLAESLRQLASNTQAIASDVAVIAQDVGTQKVQMAEMLSLMVAQDAEITALRQAQLLTARKMAHLTRELLEDPVAG